MSLARIDVSCSLTTVWISKAIVNNTIRLTFQDCCFLLPSKLVTQDLKKKNHPGTDCGKNDASRYSQEDLYV